MAEQPAAQGTHEKAHGENGRGVHQLRCLAVCREECRGEIQRERCIDIPVVPLDKVTYGAGKDGAQALRMGKRRGARVSRGLQIVLLRSGYVSVIQKCNCARISKMRSRRSRPWRRACANTWLA